ncbi:cytochrome P450 [Dermacoccus sp. SAI-028]|uniref:cytochrome P450 n=1 Tax=Dermacoccus sp. SAI-028 TaxID=2768432 RepID=UPI00190FA293|nr:cytochrome P450 [Dermacoccus sp. SAI-028]
MPESEYETVLRLGGHAASSLDLGLDWATFRRTESALDEFDAWLETHLAAKRAQPGDGLFSALIQAQDDGVGLSDRELKSVAGLVLAAGFETTVNLLGNAIRLIVGHPEQLAALRSGEASWLNAVEETLRFDPPVLLTARTATCDTRVADVDVAAGTLVVTVLAAANRDPKIFDDPDAFDVHRENAREHLAFSAGRHFCLGAALSRMESEVALRAFFDRFDVELLPGATRRPTRILRGYATLPARLAARG